MRVVPKLTVMCFVTSSTYDPHYEEGRNHYKPYINSYFDCRRLLSRKRHQIPLHTSSIDYDDVLDGPYYNRDFESEDYERELEEEEAADGDLDDTDRQLMEIEEEKKMQRRLSRMIKRSADMELPKTQVETQRMFPPGNPNDEAANKPPEELSLTKMLLMQADAKKNGAIIDDEDVTLVSGQNGNDRVVENEVPEESRGIKRYTDEELEKLRSEVPPLEAQFDEYDPVKIPSLANTTSEMITSIIQKPNVKGIDGLDQTFKIKDYTEMDDPPIPEDHIWLDAINEERKEKGKPEIPLEEGKNLRDNPEFVKDLKDLRLKQLNEMRQRARENREKREEMNNTFYRKLPRNEMGFAQMEEADIEKLHFQEVREELRARGHRTGGGERVARNRLAYALKEKDDWRYKNIVQQPLDETNEKLPDHSREKIIELKQKMNLLEEVGDEGGMRTAIERLKARQDVIRFYEDPVGYLELDRNEPSRDETPEELEEMRNAPVIHDTQFIDAMQDPINRLPDIIPRTFNLQPDVERPYPEYKAMNKAELEELKKEYLNFKGGIHEQTLLEISRRYEISLDFLGDACCRLGAKVPIPLDMPLRGIISYSAMWDLIEFLNIADTVEVETFYTFLDIEAVAKELKKPVDEIVKACDKLGVKLPFGLKTKLNLHCLTILEKVIKDPDLNLEVLARDSKYRDPFDDTNDRRPSFPNSMQDDIYDNAVRSGNILDEEESYGAPPPEMS